MGCGGAGTGQPLEGRVTSAKVMAGMLPTADGVVARNRCSGNSGISGGEGLGSTACRLCGKTAQGGETDYHVLWECAGRRGEAAGTGSMIATRRAMLAKLDKALVKAGLRQGEKAVMPAMFELRDGVVR